MSGSGALPNHEAPEGSILYGALEDFASATGADWLLYLVNSVTAAATGYTNLEAALEKIASQIGFPEFAHLLLAAFEGIAGSILDFLPWFINLTDFLGFDLDIDPADFNLVAVGIAFIKRLLSFLDPTNLSDIPILGEFVEAITGATGGLADVQTFLQQPFGAIQEMIDQIWDAFDSGIFGNTIGNPVFSVFSAVLGIFGIGSNAQSVNIIQDARLDALTGGTGALSDAFDGAADAALNPAKWNQTYAGAGGGSCGLSGDGFCVWYTGGTTTRASRNRFLTAATTDTQSVAIQLGASLGDAGGQDPEIWLIGRMNSAEDEYIQAIIRYGSAEIGYVLGGVYTRLGAAALLSTDSSGTWQLKLGTTTDDREFVLLRNGATVMSRTDTLDASSMSSGHRYVGFGMLAGNGFSFPFGFPYQYGLPPCGAWAAADRDPAT